MIDIDRAVELEEKKLTRDYENGLIDSQEYNRVLNGLYRDAHDAIEEEARQAYDEVKNRYR